MRVTRAVAIEREQAAWQMRQEGYKQTTIAERLGVAESTVSEALKRLEVRVLAEMNAEAAAVKARVTAQLWQHYEDLRKMYDASRAPKRSQRLRRAGGLLQEGRAEGRDREGEGLLESKIEERIGDVAIFREMRATLETILKIWGGFAPTKVAPTNPAGDQPYQPDEGFTDEERARRIKALLAKVGVGDLVEAAEPSPLSARAPQGKRRKGVTG
jgi:predicted transcriptional regulator